VCVVPDGTDAPGRHSVSRPFSPRVLVAAVARALREDRAPGVAPHHPEDVLHAGGLTVYPGDHTVLVDGSPIALTSTEFELLTYLMRHPGRVHSRERLLTAVWASPGSAGTRTVDVHVAQMRAKLGTASPIRTVRGVGYAIDM
jgi:DNA-binding response OmpR family regulator